MGDRVCDCKEGSSQYIIGREIRGKATNETNLGGGHVLVAAFAVGLRVIFEMEENTQVERQEPANFARGEQNCLLTVNTLLDRQVPQG